MDRFQILPHIAAPGAAYALALPIGWDRDKGGQGRPQRRPENLSPFAIAACGFLQAAESLLVNSPEGIARTAKDEAMEDARAKQEG